MMLRPHTIARTAGFTLVELMIVILVASILFAIALPTYQNQIRKSRRTEAKTAVLDLAAREEKFFSLNNSYTNAQGKLGYAAAASTAAVSGTAVGTYYTISACPGNAAGSTSATTACGAATAGSSYVIAAVPVAGQSQTKDTQCQYFAIDNTGAQFASSTGVGGTDTTSTCWQ